MSSNVKLYALSPAMAEEVNALIDAKLQDLPQFATRDEPYLKVKDAALLASVAAQTLRLWISQRRVPVYRPGGSRSVRVRLSDIMKAETQR